MNFISELPKPCLVNWNVGGGENYDSPPTPIKPRYHTPNRFEELHTSLENGVINYRGKRRAVTYIGRGSYCSVYSMKKTPSLVIKAFHGRRTGFKVEPLIAHALGNYRTVKKYLPVAQIVNEKRAQADGYFLQRKISYPVTCDDPKQLTQIERFFALSVEKNIMMDLQPENFRVTTKGKVVLIDFVEEQDSVSVFISGACRAWAALFRKNCLSEEKGRALLTQLTSSFLEKNPDYSKEWLNEMLLT